MDKANVVKERNSNIELLRIISMFMVLVLHCLSATGALEYMTGVNYYVYWWLEAACIVAVNVFVLISGYFMVNSSFKVQRVLKIWGQVWVYSVLFSVVDLLVRKHTLSSMYILYMICPLLTKRYWFVNSYLLLYLLSPFLNRFIHGLSKKKFTMFLGYLLLFFSVRITFLPLTWSQDGNAGMGIIWFVTLYCVAAWIRLYYKQDGRWKCHLSIYLIMTILLLLGKRIIMWIGIGVEYSSKLYSYCSVVVLLESIALFLFFLNRKMIVGKMGKWINQIARHSFSVYIIHFTITGVLWTRILSVDKWIGHAGTGVVAVVLSTVLVFILCVIVDSIKERIETRVCRDMENTKIIHRFTRFCSRWENMVNMEEE